MRRPSGSRRTAGGREGRSSVTLKPHHGFERVLLVSGDRESEVRYLAEKVGITRGLRQPKPRTEARARPRRDQKGRHRLPGRRHQRRPGTDRCDGRHRLRPGQRRHGRSSGGSHPGKFAGASGRAAPHRPADASNRIADRRSVAWLSAWSAMLLAAEGYLPPVAGAVTAGGHRCSGCPQRLADIRDAACPEGLLDGLRRCLSERP